MSDIRERLRAYGKAIASWQGNSSASQCALVREATAEIGSLRRENVILTNALGLSSVELKRTRKALSDLVALKEYRDWHGKTPDYLEKKPLAWQQARDALARVTDAQEVQGTSGFIDSTIAGTTNTTPDLDKQESR